MTTPFKIESADINRLTDIKLTQLLKELLHAEASKFGIPQSSIDVASNIHAGDGGEDGRISWTGEPDRTDFIPNRLTVFQCKATGMSPQQCANEILAAKRAGQPPCLKSKVEEVLSSDGAYILFTNKALNKKQKDARIDKIRRTIRELGEPYAEICQIEIYDSSKISGWVNQFISTIVSVQNWVGLPYARGLKTFELWGQDRDLLKLCFVSVDSQKSVIESFGETLVKPRSCIRVMGLSGLGKTRTAYQFFAEKEELQSKVVYADADIVTDIGALAANGVNLELEAILVIDNCNYVLHEQLVREVTREGSKISLLTLDYDINNISFPTILHRLEPMKDDEIRQLLEPSYGKYLPDLDRIAAYAQGFPQMAFLLAEARLSQNSDVGVLTDDAITSKLLWKRDKQSDDEHKDILQVCSLFDSFGWKGDVEYQLKYIANLADVSIDRAYACIEEYKERGVINAGGRFAQVAPKPLAIRLAGEWWKKTREARRKEVVDKIPDGMVESFCKQIEMLDFHTDVKALTQKLCGYKSPFGQAKEILSSRGSRLFRSFVHVNPEATSDALYRAISVLDKDALYSIKYDVRRNLIWALERLCFHDSCFEQSAWCMLSLASAENELSSNNATGQFAQLYQVFWSGTSARPDKRLKLIQRALERNDFASDMVILEALKRAINTRDGVRLIGAEYQGTRPPLEEWRPKVQDEIFSYWNDCFDLLVLMFSRGDQQAKEVLNLIGPSIRDIVTRGQLKILDKYIRKIVNLNGRYWPSALEGIQNTLEYGSKKFDKTAIKYLESWLALLAPVDGDIPEQLQILVIDPPWEIRKRDEDQIVDLASEKAKELARKVSRNVEELYPHVHSLLSGKQKQAKSFGKELSLMLKDVDELLKVTVDQFKSLESPHPDFLLGILAGVYEYSPEKWQALVNEFINDDKLARYYPEIICERKIVSSQLDVLLDLVKRDVVPIERIVLLGCGQVAASIKPIRMAEFCLSISRISDAGTWVALDVLFMYLFPNKEEIKDIQRQSKELVLSVSLDESRKEEAKDLYKWHELSKKLLSDPDDEFAKALALQILVAAESGFDYEGLLYYIKPTLRQLLKEYSNVVWPVMAEAIRSSEGMQRYGLLRLLQGKNDDSNQDPSLLSEVPVDHVMDLCAENEDNVAAFVAECTSVLVSSDDGLKPSQLFVEFLKKFGGNEHISNALSAGARSWVGSLVPHLQADKEALSPLLNHENSHVSAWVRNHISEIDKQIEYESGRDAERKDFGI